MCSVFPFSLLQLAVFTRFLEPAEYGELALLMFFSGLSTMIMNLVTLQGALIVTYGHSGDDGGDDGMDDGGGDMGAVDEDLGTQQLVKDRQLALTTGVWIMVAVMVVVTVPVFLFATPIAGFSSTTPTAARSSAWPRCPRSPARSFASCTTCCGWSGARGGTWSRRSCAPRWSSAWPSTSS